MHRATAAYAVHERPATDEELVSRHARTIERIARRIALRTGSLSVVDDLWSAGALGLLDAARRFDGARDVDFDTFVEHRIRGAMLDELRRIDHLPRRLRARTLGLEKARQDLARELVREPTADELAARLGIDPGEVAELEALAQRPLSLVPELAEASPEEPVDERLASAQRRRQLAAAIGRLPERLQILMSLRYVEELSYKEIARVLKVSEPRVCQLHGEAVAKLRALLGNEAA
jgi:RNA polymerase sigma factor for flagellar operon FliA